MYVVVIAFATSSGMQGLGVLDQKYETLEECEMARPEAVDAFSHHVAQYETTITGSECSFGGIGGTRLP